MFYRTYAAKTLTAVQYRRPEVKRVSLDREFISREREGISLKDPLALLREWAEKYDYRKNLVQEYYSVKSVTDIEDALTAYGNKRNIQDSQ